jgi:uncharacterized membrane protein
MDSEHKELYERVEEVNNKLTMLTGHMVGINGKRGFFDEVRDNFDKGKAERQMISDKMELLEDVLTKHMAASEGRFKLLEKDIDRVSSKVECHADKIAVLEGKPGKRLSDTAIFLAKNLGRIVIGGLLVLLALGVQSWLESGG